MDYSKQEDRLTNNKYHYYIKHYLNNKNNNNDKNNKIKSPTDEDLENIPDQSLPSFSRQSTTRRNFKVLKTQNHEPDIESDSHHIQIRPTHKQQVY